VAVDWSEPLRLDHWGKSELIRWPGLQRDVYYGLGYLRANVAEKKHEALACDIDRAQGLMCEETWGADR